MGRLPLSLLQVVPDTLSNEPPLPGVAVDVLRFFFHVPQWIQIGGALLAAVLAVVLAAYLWRRRSEIGSWLRTRSRQIQLGLAAAVFAVIVAASWLGVESWNYMQHANEFCVGCHVMDPSVTRFTRSEHSRLECHDCHRQPLSASMRQLYLWVLERPEEIGEHAPVPNAICAECHIQQQPDSVWQRIASTAGHRVHLESDSAALEGVMCVTCHGEEVHRFLPATETCGQADCHAQEDTEIVLGEMAGAQTTFHCLGCHEFTRPVAEFASLDTAAMAMSPGREECLSCHEMERVTADAELRGDPHGPRSCGYCHNPHTQELPEAAFATCTDAGCHENPRELSSFHRGIGERVLDACGECHEPHRWEVDGQDCQACHSERF